jgi:hypothetical protein
MENGTVENLDNSYTYDRDKYKNPSHKELDKQIKTNKNAKIFRIY